MRIAYMFTTFPKLSERFFLREVQTLREQGVAIEVYSMIGGQELAEAGEVRHFRGMDWVLVWFELLIWMIRKPLVTLRLLAMLNPFRYRSLINYGENALGLAFAVRFARAFSKEGFAFCHGTWATAPGMAAYALLQLIGQAYTLEAHAYDVFRNGGDAYLVRKLSAAQALRSSTEATAGELRQRLANAEAVGPDPICVRRGLQRIPEYQAPSYLPAAPLRVVSVGRLIEKKGYLEQLEIFRYWRDLNIPFEAKIIGEGGLDGALKQRIQDLDLTGQVTLTGKLDYAAVDGAYRAANLFLFNGKISASGDRDGFPNVIGEAMSFGLPIFTTDVSGTTEGVRQGYTGFIIDGQNPQDAAIQIYLQMQSVDTLHAVTHAAYDWVSREFSVAHNVRKLRAQLWGLSD